MAIRSSEIESNTPGRHARLTYLGGVTTATSSGNIIGTPFANLWLADIVLSQAAAGTGGTSWAATVKKNGTTVCSTDGVLALASGANKSVDCLVPKLVGTVPTGATRPVLSATAATLQTVPGDVWTVDITVTGTYSPGFVPAVTLVFADRSTNGAY